MIIETHENEFESKIFEIHIIDNRFVICSQFTLHLFVFIKKIIFSVYKYFHIKQNIKYINFID